MSLPWGGGAYGVGGGAARQEPLERSLELSHLLPLHPSQENGPLSRTQEPRAETWHAPQSSAQPQGLHLDAPCSGP